MDKEGPFAPALAKHLIRFSNEYRSNPTSLTKFQKTSSTSNTGNDSRNRTILMNLQAREPNESEEECDIRSFQYALLMLKSIPAGMPEHLVAHHSNLRTENDFPNGLLNRDKLDVIKADKTKKKNGTETISKYHMSPFAQLCLFSAQYNYWRVENIVLSKARFNNLAVLVLKFLDVWGPHTEDDIQRYSMFYGETLIFGAVGKDRFATARSLMNLWHDPPTTENIKKGDEVPEGRTYAEHYAHREYADSFWNSLYSMARDHIRIQENKLFERVKTEQSTAHNFLEAARGAKVVDGQLVLKPEQIIVPCFDEDAAHIIAQVAGLTVSPKILTETPIDKWNPAYIARVAAERALHSDALLFHFCNRAGVSVMESEVVKGERGLFLKDRSKKVKKNQHLIEFCGCKVFLDMVNWPDMEDNVTFGPRPMEFTKLYFNRYAIEAWGRSAEEKVWIVPGPYDPAGYANDPRKFDKNGNPTDDYHRTPNAKFVFLDRKAGSKRYRRIGIQACRDWEPSDKGEILVDYGSGYGIVPGISVGTEIKRKRKRKAPSTSSSETQDSSTSYESQESSTSYESQESSDSSYSPTVESRSKSKKKPSESKTSTKSGSTRKTRKRYKAT